MNESETASAGGKNYADFSRDELIAEIKRLNKYKKYGLVWEQKTEKVIADFLNHYPYLEEDASRRIINSDENKENLIIEGDNFDSLSILNYTHAGKVDVIYIDPPYNTGNKDFVYNDSYVDIEDSFRHSKWLSFMEPRLKLAKNLLNSNGFICISIDENELFALKLLMDDIFGSANYIGCAPRKGRGAATTKGTAELQTLNDYLLIYAKNKTELILQKKIIGKRTYPYKDERGEYYIVPLQDNGPHGTREARPNLWYPIYVLNDNTLTYEEPEQYKEKILPKMHQNKEGRWMWSKKKFDTDSGDLLAKNGVVYIKHYYKEGEDQNKYQYEKLWFDDSWLDDSKLLNARGTKTLANVLGYRSAFSNPKPVELVKWCIKLSTNKNATVLDFFAGSGTTGQAVMELNAEDGGHRQFILCTNNGDKGENSVKIAEDVTYVRNKIVITGTRKDGSKYSEGLPENLRYYKVEYLDKAPTIDQNCERAAPYISDILQLKENNFNLVAEGEDYDIFFNGDNYLVLILNTFSQEKAIDKLKEMNKNLLPAKVYTFSYSRDSLEEDYELNFDIEFHSMPVDYLRSHKKIEDEIMRSRQ